VPELPGQANADCLYIDQTADGTSVETTYAALCECTGAVNRGCDDPQHTISRVDCLAARVGRYRPPDFSIQSIKEITSGIKAAAKMKIP
jgi:hypothetical protein